MLYDAGSILVSEEKQTPAALGMKKLPTFFLRPPTAIPSDSTNWSLIAAAVTSGYSGQQQPLRKTATPSDERLIRTGQPLAGHVPDERKKSRSDDAATSYRAAHAAGALSCHKYPLDTFCFVWPADRGAHSLDKPGERARARGSAE